MDWTSDYNLVLFSNVSVIDDCYIKLNGWLPSVSGPFEGISYYPREILVGQFRPG